MDGIEPFGADLRAKIAASFVGSEAGFGATDATIPINGSILNGALPPIAPDATALGAGLAATIELLPGDMTGKRGGMKIIGVGVIPAATQFGPGR